MKIRLVEDENGKYIIQEKWSYFSRWDNYDDYNSLDEAKFYLERRIFNIENCITNKIIKKKLTLIEQYNLKDI